jgi:hypothetical protein
LKYYNFIFSAFLLLVFSSCKKNSDKVTNDPQAKLSFSQNEITFDTIFTSVGSITQRLWVYNDNSHAVNISRIQLARFHKSSYTLTINGMETLETSDFELRGKDSLLILVKVLIDPQNLSLPYLVDDSIVFTTNGNIQDVDLMAYGQDANFLTNTTVCTTTWTDTKPYVINGTVTVTAGCILTIDLGTRVRFHKDAKLVVAGTLITQGTKDSIVTFAHDNLSNYYDEVPGQWGGIIFKGSSTNNHLVYTEIKNATNGIVMKETPVDGDTIAELKIENTVVKNCSGNGIMVTNTDFYAVNSLINNCVGYLFKASSGGNYYFDFCTLANFSYDFFREAPILRLSNQDVSISNPLLAGFRNTTLWGDKTEEVELHDNGSSGFSFNADYSIFKTNNSTIPTNNNLFNSDPLFTSEYNKKFTLKTGSPAIDSGITLPSITDDLVGTTRDANPDRGCYEK